MGTTEGCRGCDQDALGQNGLVYEFGSGENWLPRSVIIDVDMLNSFLREKPRPICKEHRDSPELTCVLEFTEVCEEHVRHVALTYPPMIGEFEIVHQRTGERRRLRFCPDGNHRLRRQLQERDYVEYYPLTREEILQAATYPCLE